MGTASSIFILLALLLEVIQGISYIISNAIDSYLPDFILITISSVLVFLPFLATIFSLINCFSNKTTTKLQKILLLSISSALFFTNLNWLITWFQP